jgi:ubiquinone/menaquinone biosynthesis C-methylase UbiE
MSRVTDYDAVAAGYDVRYRTFDFGEITDAIRAFLGDAPVGAALEVGCGTGHWLKLLAAGAPLVAGVDASGEMIGRAKGSGAHLARGLAEALPWCDATFDRVICINALHHFRDRDAFFRECRRVLRPRGGLLNVGLDPHAERDTWWIYDYFPETQAIDRQRYAAVRTIRGELVRADFSWSESWEVQTFEHQMPAREAFDRGLVARDFSSQLAVLSPEEFEAGVARIRAAMVEAEQRGSELMLASELHLFAVTGWLG